MKLAGIGRISAVNSLIWDLDVAINRVLVKEFCRPVEARTPNVSVPVYRPINMASERNTINMASERKHIHLHWLGLDQLALSSGPVQILENFFV